MAYDYQTERPWTLTDHGTKAVIGMAVNLSLVGDANVLTGERLINMAVMRGAGTSWEAMAVVDRLVELGYLRQVSKGEVWQYNVYRRA